jgi:hypothetical protein
MMLTAGNIKKIVCIDFPIFMNKDIYIPTTTIAMKLGKIKHVKYIT